MDSGPAGIGLDRRPKRLRGIPLLHGQVRLDWPAPRPHYGLTRLTRLRGQDAKQRIDDRNNGSDRISLHEETTLKIGFTRAIKKVRGADIGGNTISQDNLGMKCLGELLSIMS